jgi:hypothetical protein
VVLSSRRLAFSPSSAQLTGHGSYVHWRGFGQHGGFAGESP